MSEESIINALSHWIDERKFPFQLYRSFIYKHECDYWAMTSGGETREFEIKISRADYFVDAKKEKHASCNDANYFYYVCPKGLILPNEVDKKYGLIYVTDNGLQIVKKPRRLNDKVFDDWKGLANKMYWKYRALWREKFIGKEISHAQYVEGFSFQLLQEEYT